MELLFGVLMGIFVGIASAGYMFIQPIADRDKTISNQKAMIKNRNEKLEKVILERNELRKYKQNVENIINSKGTIVNKLDKIIEVTTTANVK